ASATTDGAPSELVLFPVILSLLFAMVLLIACANVAGLLLARSATRGLELALRTALGASRATLVQTLLTESFLLATAGATAGIVAALWLMPILRERVIPGLGDGYLFIEPNRRVWIFALTLTAVTGLVCGLVPALKATRRRFISMDLHHDTSAHVTARLRLRHAFVVAQVAASLTLLVVSTLFLQSLLRVATFNPGFDID